MKTRFWLGCAVLVLPWAAQAACTSTDFAIEDFKPAVAATRLNLPGELVNHCATAAAAQLRIDIKDASGKVIQTKQAWPAGTSNIAPGDKVNFNLGRMFRPSPDMSSFTATVVDVRTW